GLQNSAQNLDEGGGFDAVDGEAGAVAGTGFGPGIYVLENYRVIDFFSQFIIDFGPYVLARESAPERASAFRLQAKRIGGAAFTEDAARVALLLAVFLVQNIGVYVRAELRDGRLEVRFHCHCATPIARSMVRSNTFALFR